jgi:hypothetical protein
MDSLNAEKAKELESIKAREVAVKTKEEKQ